MTSIFGLNFIEALHKYLSSLSISFLALIKSSVSIAALCAFLFIEAPNKSYN